MLPLNNVYKNLECKKAIYYDENAGKSKKDNINVVHALKDKTNNIYAAKNISQMATSLNQNNSKPNFIVICGHGASGLLGLGSVRSEDYKKGNDFCFDKLADIENEIELIRNSLDSTKPLKPVLFLAGCEVGSGEAGKKLLIELSNRIHDVVIVASINGLKYKIEDERSIHTLKIKTNDSKNKENEFNEFRFAFNGKIVTKNFTRLFGISQDELENELTTFAYKK